MSQARQATMLLKTYEAENQKLKAQVAALRAKKANTEAALSEARREIGGLERRIARFLHLPCSEASPKKHWSFKGFWRALFRRPTLHEMRGVDESWMISAQVDPPADDRS